MTSFLLVLARVPGPVVTGFLATLGSLGLGMAVMTDCTNTYSCSTGTCSPCLATSALLIGGWGLQGLLLAVSLALWLPGVVRRLSRRRLASLALLVPLVSVLAFAGVAWTAERSYCRPGQDAGNHEDYCDVKA